MDGPLLLELSDEAFPDELVVTYDLPNQSYRCYETAWSGMKDFKLRSVSPANGRERFGHPVAIYEEVSVSASPADLANNLRTLSRS